MLQMLFASALAEEGSAVQEAVSEVGDFFETAGDKAGNVIKSLPVLSTKLAMAALAIFVGVIVIRIGRRMIQSIVKMRGQKAMKTAAQMNTLKSLVTSIFNYIMYFIILTIALSIFGVNVSSILAVAGVGGIAISFGAQTLVKDIISGMFIWMEGSIAVGDIVNINGLAGTVKSIAIRTTVVRDFNGNLYVIPNGDIRTFTNMSRGYKRAIVDVRCPYEVDQARIVAILNEEMDKAPWWCASRPSVRWGRTGASSATCARASRPASTPRASRCPITRSLWSSDRGSKLQLRFFSTSGIIELI